MAKFWLIFITGQDPTSAATWQVIEAKSMDACLAIGQDRLAAMEPIRIGTLTRTGQWEWREEPASKHYRISCDPA